MAEGTLRLGAHGQAWRCLWPHVKWVKDRVALLKPLSCLVTVPILQTRELRSLARRSGGLAVV